jgi:hypothetical protein
MNLSARSNGDIITLYLNSGTRPNFFTVRASNGNGVVDSGGWLGNVTYASPSQWGSSIQNEGLKTIQFTYNSSLTYSLEVEVGLGDGSTVDAWSALFTCASPSAPTPTPTNNYIGSGLTICGGGYLYFTRAFIDSGRTYFVPGINQCFVSAGYITNSIGLTEINNGTTSIPCQC